VEVLRAASPARRFGEGGPERLLTTDRTSLGRDDFRLSTCHGFGQGRHTYAHSMAWFGEHLYVGTTVHTLCMTHAAPPAAPAQLDPWPVRVPKDIFSLDLRAEIWRFDPVADLWEQAYVSPVIVGRRGLEVPRDLGYRGMAVCQAEGESRPALYVGSGASATRGIGAHVLRTEDGRTFTVASSPGLGDPDVASFRALVSFRGRLYTSPAGAAKAWNVAARPSVLESREPASGRWEEASPPGFGDSDNQAIFEMAVFDDHLYAGTANPKSGYQVWKTDGAGRPPYRWTKVLGDGAGRGRLNEGVTSMRAFDGALYVGSGIQHGGYDRNFEVGPAAAELIRIYPNDDWDIVAGGPRETARGWKEPLSGMGPGFNNFFVGYIWYLMAHEGRIYVGTFDSSTFLRFARGSRARRWLRRVDLESVLKVEGGFDLWSSADGVTWTAITRTGFDNLYNYGARTMASSPYGLFVGTANPFAPEVAVRQEDGTWRYELNPRGGLEVWWGRHAEAP
jgi:hypothetical protein